MDVINFISNINTQYTGGTDDVFNKNIGLTVDLCKSGNFKTSIDDIISVITSAPNFVLKETKVALITESDTAISILKTYISDNRKT